MPHTAKKQQLIALVGPTAVGKTNVSLALGRKINAEIISADSRLIYEGMDIGTAKPSAAEQGLLKHHLIDIVKPDDTVSLSKFIKLANAAILDINRRGKTALMVGGTGQYYRAITQGWRSPEVPPNEVLRNVLQSWGEEIGADELHSRLKSIDPKAADNMDAKNLRRVIRALEVIFITGRTFSSQRQQVDVPFDVITLGLIRPRDESYKRIDKRVDEMLAAGFVDEVKSLMDMGYSKELPSFSAIGYRQIAEYIEGGTNLDDAIVEMKRVSRILVRRQANWFKMSDPDIQWFAADESPVDKMLEYIEQSNRNLRS